MTATGPPAADRPSPAGGVTVDPVVAGGPVAPPSDGLPPGAAAGSVAALLDGSGSLSWASPGFQRLTGLATGTGRADFLALAAPSSRPRLEAALVAAAEPGAASTVRVGGRRADGLPFVAELLVERAGRARSGGAVVALTGGRFGGPVGRAGEIEPVTEQRPGIDVVLSHDLRGALRHASGFAGVVRRAVVAAAGDGLADGLAPVPERLDTALGAVATADEMAASCVRYLRAIDEPVALEPISLERLVARASVSARSLLGDVDPPVAVEGGDVVLMGSPERLTDALAELLVNAVRFGGEAVTVAVSARSVGPGWLEVIVHDDGPGIDPALAEDAFLPGRMLQPRGRFPGVGMGLASVRLIATRHGGSIRVDPAAPSPGTTMVLELPAASVADDR
jgi:signal transduction histidine kinase